VDLRHVSPPAVRNFSFRAMKLVHVDLMDGLLVVQRKVDGCFKFGRPTHYQCERAVLVTSVSNMAHEHWCHF